MEILHTEPILTESFIYNLFGAVVITSVSLSIMCLIIASCTSSLNWIKTALSFAFLFLVAIIATIIIRVEDKDTTETGLYRYEVIFEENYPLKKVYDDYEIIERKGEIWIIEDKNV